MMTNRLKIGEFSRLCRVTVRTLRHYEQINLLVPEIVDQFTGYRYYSIEQLQKMQSILQLKGMGFSLEEIRMLHIQKGRLRRPLCMWSIRDSNSSPLDCQSNALAR